MFPRNYLILSLEWAELCLFEETCTILFIQPYAIWNPDFRHRRSRYPTLVEHLGEFAFLYRDVIAIFILEFSNRQVLQLPNESLRSEGVGGTLIILSYYLL